MSVVYKYYPPTEYTKDALLNGYFFFCKAKSQNDPFEASFKLVNNPIFRDYLIEKCNVDPNADQVMGNYGICCFSKEKNNKHLWAHYAANYSGIVVGYEDSFFEQIANNFLIRLPYVESIYVNQCPTFDNEYEDLIPKYIYPELGPEGLPRQLYLSDVKTDQKSCDEFFIRLCSTKEKATWGNEKELRLLACRDVTEQKNRLEKRGVEFVENGYKIPFPKDCVQEIIIGHNCKLDRSFIDALKKNYPNIQTLYKTSPEIPFEISITSI